MNCAPRYWLRCRLIAGSYPAGHPPAIDFLRPNTIPAENLVSVAEELLLEALDLSRPMGYWAVSVASLAQLGWLAQQRRTWEGRTDRLEQLVTDPREEQP